MHPEMNYRIAQLRHEELIGTSRRPARTRRGVRDLFRRRRHTRVAVAAQPPPIVLLPPPREERDTAGHDERVA